VGIAETVELQPYDSESDGPFLVSAIQFEDFEDGRLDLPDATISPDAHFVSVTSTVGGTSPNSVDEDGQFLQVAGICTRSIPPQCHSTLAIEFAADRLPSAVGFVWTDAVRGTPSFYEPWTEATATAYLSDGTVLDVLHPQVLDAGLDPTADDTFLGFFDTRGIAKVEFAVFSDEGDRLAIDHLQYGWHPLAGDIDGDGTVDFQDFTAFAANYGKTGGWRQGDFDFDRRVEFSDFLKLAENFGSASIAATVPEPGGLAMVICVALAAAFGCRRIVGNRQ
jgi:hypothetical protein